MPKETLNYVMYPKNMRSLSKELKLVADDYWAGKTSEQEVKEMILHYVSTTKLLDENGIDINPTVRIAIGQQRLAFLKNLLKDYMEK